ncbi:extracellular solute-binding protein [Xylanibacillus composti]|uniref:Extracellular solute-binding protein n=1 Tax=Xylanibacillus composti TaxID=1572762 RepID=A0A8J4GZ52_9BACL|nr:extracellular solute-binding protein [Xylanibacillus composti]MDT9724331.1 extracellular solute-binding protein [Xylanibacillus composti]GIQ67922.1 extracellular solute-binding protein [Xylanibacillus composti]
MTTTNRRGARKIATVAIALSLLLSILAACTGGNATESNETRVLRIAVMYGDSSQSDYLKTQYTDLYEFTHDNIDIEFVHAIDYSSRRYSSDPYNPDNEPDPVEEMKKLIEGPNPPDIVMVSYDELGMLIDENLLSPLDSYIQNDQFDTSDFVPAVIDGLKSLGNNQLYALAPTFSSSALVYNKQLFTERGVEFPTDGMSWDEVFALAERVSYGEGQERKYGFSFSTYSYGDSLMYEMSLYTDPLQLSLFDENYERLMVDSDGWERVWQTMLDLKTKKIVPDAPDYSQPRTPSPFEGNNFLMGRVAMVPMSYGNLNELIDANRNADTIEGYNAIDWDVVTLPIHPEVGNVGGSMYMDPIMGITANAQNSEDAWDFIKFINGPEWAELKARSSYNMVSRKSYIKPHPGENYNIEAFFHLMPAPSTVNNDIWRRVPNYWEIQDLGSRKFQEVIDGDKDIRQALQEWAVEGEQALQRMRESMDNSGGVEVMPF